MKCILTATLFLCFSTFATASEYTGNNILKYVSVGMHIGENCSVEVNQINNQVFVTVQASNELAIFNSSLLKKEQISEKQTESTYEASFVLIPDESYSGRSLNRLRIQNNERTTIVTAESMERIFFFGWLPNRQASCKLQL